MRINQNIAAFNSYRNLSNTNTVMGKSLEKLSSGFRINRAADDAAGLVISQGLRAQVSGLRQATRNAQDGISVVQTAEGALNEVHTMLNRMRDLAVQAANGSNDADARAAAQAEIDELAAEIDRIAETTRFGQLRLFDGTFGGTPVAASAASIEADGVGSLTNTNDYAFMVRVDGGSWQTVEFTATATDDWSDAGNLAALQTALDASFGAGYVVADGTGGVLTLTHSQEGASYTLEIAQAPGEGTAWTALGYSTATGFSAAGTDETTGGGLAFQVGANDGDIINVVIDSLDAAGLGVNSLSVSNYADASAAITTIDGAIADVSTLRGSLGAVQNRFESTIANLQVTTENLAASESRIRDTDMALEMVSFTRHQILLQAGTAMLGQANALPQSVLRLLG